MSSSFWFQANCNSEQLILHNKPVLDRERTWNYIKIEFVDGCDDWLKNTSGRRLIITFQAGIWASLGED
jgi:hypothetical protein